MSILRFTVLPLVLLLLVSCQNPSSDSSFTLLANPIPGIIINEIDAYSDDGSTDWIELYNGGSSPVALSGYRFTDDSNGYPDSDHVTPLPALTLASGEYLVLESGSHFSFGLSNTNGEAVYLLLESGAASSSAFLSQHFPADSCADGQTFGRFPNATGSFVDCSPSSGSSNTELH